MAAPRRRTMTLAIQRFDRTAAFHTRVVSVDDVMAVHVLPAISVAGLLSGTFEAAEMPMAHYVFLRSIGAPFTAIPVFPDRLAVRLCVFTRTDAGIESLADFRGRRILTPQYWMTSSIWHRGRLKDEHGIRPEEIEWHTTSGERDARMRLPPGVKVTLSPGPHLGMERLVDGTVDALMTEGTPLVPETRRDHVVPVPRHAADDARKHLRETGFHPSVHVIALRQEAVDERPSLPEELCRAFDEAKASGYQILQNERMTALPLMRLFLDETTAMLGDDPWPYGLGDRNRRELAQVLQYAYDQGMVGRRMEPEELFHASARDFPFQARMVRGANPGSLESVLGYR